MNGIVETCLFDIQKRMDASEPDWSLYRSFLAVLREGSLSGAARALGLAQPTIGRHIAALEQALGLALFTRAPHGLAPTPAAHRLEPHAEALAAGTEALLRAASDEGAVAGTVRIAASEVVGAEVLPPILADLRAAHPALSVELTLSSVVADLLRRDADIAVRMVRPSQSALVARRIGTIALGLHAHPRYLARCGMPVDLAALDAHALIGFDRETAYIRSLDPAAMGLARRRFALATDSDLAQLAAIRAGFGIGACQVPLARRDGLVRVLPQAFALDLETWVVMHEDLRASPRCRAVFDALAAGLGTYLATG